MSKFLGAASIYRTKVNQVSGLEMQDTRELVADQNNALFSSALRSLHTSSYSTTFLAGAVITYFDNDSPVYDSDFSHITVDTTNRNGAVQAGMVTPALDVDADGYPVIIIHNRFNPPALGTTRTIQYLGLTTSYSGATRYLRSFIRLQTPCIQQDSEILDIYYRIKTTELVGDSFPLSAYYLASMFGTELNTTRFPLKLAQDLNTIKAIYGNGARHSITPVGYDESVTAHPYGNKTSKYLDSGNFNRLMRFDVSTGLSNTLVNLGQPDAVGAIFNSMYPLSMANNYIGYGAKPQLMGDADSKVQGVFINSSNSDVPFLGSLGESTIRLGVTEDSYQDGHYNRTHVISFDTADSYRLHTAKNLGFANNGWSSVTSLLPSIPHTTAYIENGATVWRQKDVVGDLKWYGYNNGDRSPTASMKVVSERAVVSHALGQSGITVLDPFTQKLRHYDSGNGLNITNLRSLDSIDNVIAVACATSGLWLIDLDTDSVTNVTTTPAWATPFTDVCVRATADDRFMVTYQNGFVYYDKTGAVVRELGAIVKDPETYFYSPFDGSAVQEIPKLVETPTQTGSLSAYAGWAGALGLPETGSMVSVSSYGGFVLPFNFIDIDAPSGNFVQVSRSGYIGFYRDSVTPSAWGGVTTMYTKDGFSAPFLLYYNRLPGIGYWFTKAGVEPNIRNFKYQANADGAIFYMEFFATGWELKLAFKVSALGDVDMVVETVGEDISFHTISLDEKTSKTSFTPADIMASTTRTLTSAGVYEYVADGSPVIPVPAGMETLDIVNLPLPLRSVGDIAYVSVSKHSANKALLVSDVGNKNSGFLFDTTTLEVSHAFDFTNYNTGDKLTGKYAGSSVWLLRTDGDEWCTVASEKPGTVATEIVQVSWNTKVVGKDAGSNRLNSWQNLIKVKDTNGNETLMTVASATNHSINLHTGNTPAELTTVTTVFSDSNYSLYYTLPVAQLTDGIFLTQSYESYQVHMSVVSYNISFKTTNQFMKKLVWKTYGWENDAWVLDSSVARPIHLDTQLTPHNVKITFSKPTGLETVIPNEYFVFGMCDSILKDNASTLAYTTTFAVGDYETFTQVDLSSPIVPVTNTVLEDVKAYRSIAFYKNAITNAVVNPEFGKFTRGDFQDDYWVGGKYNSTYFSSTSNFTKYNESCDILPTQFVMKFKAYAASSSPVAMPANARFGFVPANRLQEDTIWDVNSISYQIRVLSATASAVYEGTAKTGSGVFPAVEQGDELMITRNGTTFTFDNLTKGTSRVSEIPGLVGDVKFIISSQDSSWEALLADMTFSYETPIPIVAVGKAINQTGRYDVDFSGLATVTRVELDGVPVEVLTDTNDLPAPGQVVVLPSGFLRFNSADAGKTITTFEGNVCYKYY